MAENNSLFITTARGLETLLAQELSALEAESVEIRPAGVACRGTLETAYRICLWSRLASRVLWQLGEFAAATPDELYRGIQQTRWSEHLRTDGTLAVNFTSRRSKISHSQFGAQKVKDAIVDQLRLDDGSRPGVDLADPDVRINVHVEKDQASVALDLAGDSLHRRGYRQDTVIAPLRESLAAAILLQSGWTDIAARGGVLIDPMCGSGTLLIEAAMIAGDIAPGLLRRHFIFEKWLQHNPASWAWLLAEADKRAAAGRGHIPPIYGFDIDRRAVRAAQHNCEAAGLADLIHIERQDFADGLPQLEKLKPGLVATNPPYGERLAQDEDILAIYRQLGETLKSGFVGWQASVLAVDKEHGFALGIRSKKPWALFNGPLECRLLQMQVEAENFFIPRGEAGHRLQTLYRQADRLAAELSESANMLANRLRKNQRHWRRWAARNNIEAYRVYDADLPEYAFALDVYLVEEAPYLVLQEYQAPATIDADKAETRIMEAIAVVKQVYEQPYERIFLKIRQKQKGQSQYEKQDSARRFHVIGEGGARFWVNFEDYLDTGLFLDHRETRRMVRQLAAGREVLNLFCYTGSVTVHAALGGAKATTSVDMSKTYLDWARRNLKLNNIDPASHHLVEADCLQWLERQAKNPQKKQYDLIFLDPPTFSNSKSMKESFDIQSKQGDLIKWCLALLKKGGILLFSTNFRKFVLDESLLEKTDWQEITHETIPEDFARKGKIHRCWRIEKTGETSNSFNPWGKHQP